MRAKEVESEMMNMTGSIDEYSVQPLRKYDGEKLSDATMGVYEMSENEGEKSRFEEQRAAFEHLCKVMEDILDKKVEKVNVSNRLVTSPWCIVTSQLDWSVNVKQIMKIRSLWETSTRGFMGAITQLKINSDPSMMKVLESKVNAG